MATTGIISQSNARYLKVEQNKKTVLVPLEHIYGKPNEVEKALRHGEIRDYTGQSAKGLKEKAEKIFEWQYAVVVERVGWIGTDYYCFSG